MATTHNLGFPRMGAQRELKFALEAYWRGDVDDAELERTGYELRRRHWQLQAQLDWQPVGDFSFYDQVLDMSATLGHLPRRISALPGSALAAYFRAARGRAPGDGDALGVAALEMTKWFDTNYHYLVPELNADTTFRLHPRRYVEQIKEARQAGHKPKPVLIGPLTYLYLSKAKDNTAKLDLLPQLVAVYSDLLNTLARNDISWVQVDEPVLVMDLDEAWQRAFHQAYQTLSTTPVKLLLTTYFGTLGDHLPWVRQLPVHGLHVDTTHGWEEAIALAANWPADKVLSLGVINGRNIWRADLNALLDRLEPIHDQLRERLWLAPSCSLLHVPVDLELEAVADPTIDPEVRSWLAFARQKLEELHVLASALQRGRAAVAEQLEQCAAAVAARRASQRVTRSAVAQALATVTPRQEQRRSPYAQRVGVQQQHLNLPLFPTTTIGSFPQTATIRHARRQYRQGQLRHAEYEHAMQREIEHCVREQIALGLDVLVHGEAERNDMVEYFGEQLDGFVFSRHGWVQSYGSRCVKPPIIYGDVSRPESMTVRWSRFAQSLTTKPIKGMLTGPVTLLNWSFVRDDQPRSLTCRQLALAIRTEVLDLEQAGIAIIQIDEPALREGLPLRRAAWDGYLHWAIQCFRIAANGVRDETQIHTHMCYSEFNDIMPHIAQMDADVITIETSRSDMELLNAFEQFRYPNGIGPGVYDVHAPNIPTIDAMVVLLQKAAQLIPAQQLWVNPDCGLKTRNWDEVIPALGNMVKAARQLRADISAAA